MVKDDSWFLKTAINSEIEELKGMLPDLTDIGLEVVLQEIKNIKEKLRNSE